MLLAGCVSARVYDRAIDGAFKKQEYDKAAGLLKKGLDKQGDNGKDRLLYLLDYALALHSAGKYDEAIIAFQEADRFSEIKDYTSITEEAATLLTSENVKAYRGEEFENVLISVYLAMDYALIGKWEDARVEARRVNRKLERLKAEGGRPYIQNAFARYLSSILYEMDRDWNGALIDLKKTRELLPAEREVGKHLWRVALLNGMSDEQERIEEMYVLTDAEKKDAREWLPKTGTAEIIVLYENGIGPEKVPHPGWESLPVYRRRVNPVASARILVDGLPAGETVPMYDVESVAIQNLDAKFAGIVAKRMAARIAKEVIAHEVSKKDEVLGALTWLALVVSDQADLRSWGLLPRDFQIARLRVLPGVHTVRMEPIGETSQSQEKTIEVGARKKAFVNFRFMP